MRAITIATSDYMLHAFRLCRSLKRRHPECALTVYLDDEAWLPLCAAHGCEGRVLPEIASFGVKRAKFVAYVDALHRGGGFLYLDADIIVLERLDPLLDVEELTACRDDLRECPFIADPSRPWVSRPELSGSDYFK